MTTRTPDVRARRREGAPPPPPPDVRARLAAAAPVAGRRRGRRLGDPRGLTVLGGVVLVLVLGLPALAVDLLLGGGPGPLFGAAFALGCALAALAVHREDLRAVVVVPPLLHVGFALLAGALGGGPAPGGWLQGLATQLAGALVYQAPVLWGATAAAAGVALWRRRGGRR